MLLELFREIGVKNVSLAGFDGFARLPGRSNYSELSMHTSATIEHMEAENKIIQQNLDRLKNEMKLRFLTDSIFH